MLNHTRLPMSPPSSELALGPVEVPVVVADLELSAINAPSNVPDRCMPPTPDVHPLAIDLRNTMIDPRISGGLFLTLRLVHASANVEDPSPEVVADAQSLLELARIALLPPEEWAAAHRAERRQLDTAEQIAARERSIAAAKANGARSLHMARMVGDSAAAAILRRALRKSA